MRYLESFILGLLIACTSLFVQVFLSVITETFGYTLTLPSTVQYSFFDIFIFFFIIATTEEFLRYIIIKKRVLIYIKDTAHSLLLHSFLIGSGFWIFEIILGFTKNNTLFNSPISVISVLLIHIIASILLLFFLKKHQTTPDILAILLATIFHTISNVILFIIIF